MSNSYGGKYGGFAGKCKGASFRWVAGPLSAKLSSIFQSLETVGESTHRICPWFRQTTRTLTCSATCCKSGVIYEEAASGKSADCLELEQCHKALRAGDTLVVWRLDRLRHSLPGLVQIVAELEHRNRQRSG